MVLRLLQQQWLHINCYSSDEKVKHEAAYSVQLPSLLVLE